MTTPPATSAEEPWPVRTVARKIAAWIERLGAVWVEGQLTQVTARPGSGTAFLVLRLVLGDFAYRELAFEQIPDEVASGRADAGLLIHEGQLTFSEHGLEKVLYLG